MGEHAPWMHFILEKNSFCFFFVTVVILSPILAYTIEVYIWLPLLPETILLLKEKKTEKVEKNHKQGPWPGPCQHQSSFFFVSALCRKSRGPENTLAHAWSFSTFFSSQGHRLIKGEKIPQTQPQSVIFRRNIQSVTT